MKIKMVIFDLDGTLLNSTKEGMQNHQKLARELGIKIPTLELLKQDWGNSWLKLVDFLAQKCNWPEREKNAFIERYSQLSKSEMRYNFFPDAKKVLLELVEKGIKIVILSSRVRESKKVFSILNYLDFAGIDKKIFSFIQGAEDCKFLKPDHRVFSLIVEYAKEFSIFQDEMLYVGDTVKYDLVSADKFPIDFIGMVSGASEEKDFLQAGLPRLKIVKSLTEAKEIIEKF